MDEKEEKDPLQRIAESLERIAASLDVLARCGKESTEEFYKRHGITQTFS